MRPRFRVVQIASVAWLSVWLLEHVKTACQSGHFFEYSWPDRLDRVFANLNLPGAGLSFAISARLWGFEGAFQHWYLTFEFLPLVLSCVVYSALALVGFEIFRLRRRPSLRTIESVRRHHNSWRKRALTVMVAIVVAVVLAAKVIGYVSHKRAAAREIAYNASLASFASRFPPGTARSDVEKQLRDSGVAFTQACCFGEKTTFADLVRVGQEPKPWYCSEYNVYVVLQFEAMDNHDWRQPEPSDVLRRVELIKRGEGCL